MHNRCFCWKSTANSRLRKGFDERNQFIFAFFFQVYDTATCHKILTFNDPNSSNKYRKNLATFNPTDDLVLNDGVLWDVNGNRVIHKFDKLNNFVSGVFHPSGLEIIISSEIVSFYLLLEIRLILRNGHCLREINYLFTREI